jgi:amino acid transporter
MASHASSAGVGRGGRAAVFSGRSGRFRRDVGPVGLLFASLGSIIGSGWLFGALYASEVAGPAALLSWVIGGAAVLLLALVHAELGSMFPVAGGSARFPNYAYGGLTGFTVGWIAWLGAVTTAPIEVEAALQYSTHWVGSLTQTSASGTTYLTWLGYVVAVLLMLVFTIINVLGVRRLAQSNNLIMVWKIAIPVVTVVALFVLSFHSSNLTAAGGFAPFGAYGVLSAISSGGVIFAYLGFEQAIQLGAESANPRRNIPMAVIGSMVIGVVLYILLQLAFLGALHPSNLTHGWANITFAASAGPFAGLATLVGAGWLAGLLYTDAVISPFGTGLLYTGTSARLSYAMGHQNYIPSPLAWLSARGVPWVSITLAWVAGCVFFLPFPGWQSLVGFVTSATVLMYASAPLTLGALRDRDPDRERPYRLPAAAIIAPLSFIVANMIVYFTPWGTIWKLYVGIAIGLAVMLAWQLRLPTSERPPLDLRAGSWLFPWLLGMAVISYLGRFGGHGQLPRWWDLVTVTVFSLAIYRFAIVVALDPRSVQHHTTMADHEMGEEQGELGPIAEPA